MEIGQEIVRLAGLPWRAASHSVVDWGLWTLAGPTSWGCQELSTSGAPFGVHGRDVFDPDIEEAADSIGVVGRLQSDRRLVVGRAPRQRSLMMIQLLESAT
jgi:hypothetical protein